MGCDLRQADFKVEPNQLLYHSHKRAAYYGCCPVRAILGIFILIHTSVIVLWMIREYFYFDFKCAIVEISDEQNPENEAPAPEENSRKLDQNERENAADSDQKSDDHTAQITNRRVGESVRFPRKPHTDVPRNPATGHIAEQLSDQDSVRYTRFRRSEPPPLPVFSHVLYADVQPAPSSVRSPESPSENSGEGNASLRHSNRTALRPTEHKRSRSGLSPNMMQYRKNNGTRFIGHRNRSTTSNRRKTIRKQDTSFSHLREASKTEILSGNSRVHPRNQAFLKWSGESWEADEPKPTQKRFHFLSGGSAFSASRRNKTAPRTSWIDGVIDPEDKNFSNKGQIRFYPGRLAQKLPKKRRKNSSRRAKISPRNSKEKQAQAEEERADEQKTPEKGDSPKRIRTESKEREFEKKQQRKWKSAEDVVRRPGQRITDEAIINPADSDTRPPPTASIIDNSKSDSEISDPVVEPGTQEFSIIEEPADQFRIVADIDQPYHAMKFHTTPASPTTPLVQTFYKTPLRELSLDSILIGQAAMQFCFLFLVPAAVILSISKRQAYFIIHKFFS
ncbi:unnamed protein product [Gongylonema pulchrum]|uniref:Uncharacterized protein n=1 Tax=Gongylonema pulchrum TaxID=637853 RepID=A0A3P6QFT2_9BILA|nr:unnamed protein product [Gongylonema pulchrum]